MWWEPLKSVPSRVAAGFLLACLLPNYKIILMNTAGEGKAAERQEKEVWLETSVARSTCMNGGRLPGSSGPQHLNLQNRE